MKKDKKWVISLGIVAMLAVVAIGFFRNCQTTVEDHVVRIGAILPLTGSMANLGQENKAGILLAIEEINSSGKVFEVSFEDSKGDAKTALSAMRHLEGRGIDKVILSTTQTVLPILQAYKNNPKYLFSANCQTAGILDGYTNVFRVYFTSENETTMMANYALSNKYKRIAILRINTESGLEPITSFQRKMKDQCPTIDFFEQVFDFSDKSYKDKIQAMIDFNPDAIIVYSYPDQWEQMVKQLAECNVSCPIIANSGFGQTAEREYYKGLRIMEQIVFPAPSFVLNQHDPWLKDVCLRLRKEYGVDANYNVLYLYDNIMVLYNAIQACGRKSTNTELISQIKKLDFMGATGRISFDENCDLNLGELKMVRIVAGQYQVLQ